MGWQKILGIAAAAGLLSVWSIPAGADSVWGVRSEKLVESAHQVSITIEPGHATFVVQRTVYNGGARHDEANFFIDVPQSAVATGLRTLGLLDGKPHWFDGELMEATKAADRYKELTGISAYRFVKDPALLVWAGQRALSLQVFPVFPSAPKTIEYTLRLPTEYRDGQHHVQVPKSGTEKLHASILAKAAPKAGRLFVDGESKGTSARIVPRDFAGADLSLAPRNPPTIGGALAVVPFAKDRVLTRLRVEAAPQLGQVPRDASVVVLIDTSRSLHQSSLQAQVTAARAYLSHFVDNDGQAVVLSFDRRVRRLHQCFVSAQEAMDDLGKISFKRNNGSEVADALVEAERILAGAPAERPKRILLLTDTHTRFALSKSSIRGAMGTSGAVVHVGVVVDGEPALLRNDRYEWADAMRLTGGVVWVGSASADAADGLDAAHRAAFEEWARPKRLHHFRVTSSGFADGNLQFDDDDLDEGEGVSAGWIDRTRAAWINVEGELWARPIRKVLRPDKTESDRWSALVFGSDLFAELGEDEMMPLAMRGGAVSPVTSYLAIEPGVRPSSEGLDHGGGGRGEGIGLGAVGTIGHGAGRASSSFDHNRYVARRVAAAWRRCGGRRGQGAQLSLEISVAEVVDTSVSLPPGDSAELVAHCWKEAVWSFELPEAFRRIEHQGWLMQM